MFRKWPNAQAPCTLTRGRSCFPLSWERQSREKKTSHLAMFEKRVRNIPNILLSVQPKYTAAFARISGCRGRANLAWSSPSVHIKRISQLGSADWLWSCQRHVLSLYCEWRWNRYCCRTWSLPSTPKLLSPNCCFKTLQTSQVVKRLFCLKRSMSCHLRL